MILLRSIVFLSAALACTAVIADEIDTRHYIYIEAKGTVTAPPDHATVEVSVVKKGQTPQEVVDGNITDTDKLFNALIALGISEADVQTSNFIFETVYIRAEGANNMYQQDDPDRDTFDGYRVRNSVSIDVKDLPKIGTVLAGIARLGNEIGSVTFLSSKAPAYYAQARDVATANALAKAQAYAASTGVKLGDLLSLREGGGYDTDTMEYAPSEGEADLIIPIVRIAPGTLSFSSSISAKWEVTAAGK